MAAHLGDARSAATIYDVLEPFGEYVASHPLIWLGTVPHHLGMLATLGRWNDADMYLTAAATSHARIGAPAWLARTRLGLAQMLLARRQAGDLDRALPLCRDALKTARELGLGNIERRTAELLDRFAS